MSKVYQDYLEAKRNYETADRWATMQKRGGGRMGGDSFAISVDHSAIKLVRCGQYQTGGQNYWETDAAFNKCLLEWIVANIDTVQEGALALMKQKEHQALIKCKEFVAEIQSAINQADTKVE
jgi:hypothetical protein